ncbi:MAG: STAS domain-containing protein [Candidatus Acidiferrales bacterium]
MELKQREVETGFQLFELAGSIHTGPECKRLDQAVSEHMEHNQNRIIFDFTHVTHIDSSVIGIIVKSHGRLKKSGGELRLVVAAGMVEKVLKLTQIHRVITLYPTTADAMTNTPPQKTAP